MNKIDLKRLEYSLSMNDKLECIIDSKKKNINMFKNNEFKIIDNLFKPFSIIKNKKDNSLYIFLFAYGIVSKKYNVVKETIMFCYRLDISHFSLCHFNDFKLDREICTIEEFQLLKKSIDRY